MIPYIVRFENIYYVNLVWILPVLVLLYFLYFRKKDAVLRGFASLQALKTISVSTSRARQKTKAALMLLVILAIIGALMRPQGDPTKEEIKQVGRDILFLLDVSESMNATDLKPSRLERAKIAISDLIGKLQGDRIGLIVFAGSSSLKSPLTHDYGFFTSVLKNVSTSDIPEAGTNIGDAIRKAEEIFSPEEKKYKDIILITDGEDQNSWPVKAAERAAHNSGIRIFTVGLGDPDIGALIQLDKVDADDTIHRSKLNTKLLQEIALAHPDGAFLPVKTGNFNLAKVYLERIATAEKKELQSTKTVRWKDFFQIPLGIALLLLLCEVTFSERRRKSEIEKNKNIPNSV